MTSTADRREEADAYHRRLPERIVAYLAGRGIPRLIVDRHLLGWDGRRITIPITDQDGRVGFFRLAKDPGDRSGAPKMLATPGSSAGLYGWEVVASRPRQLVVCEGELDRLVLESQGFAAITSTGGAGTFRESWAAAVRHIPEIFICFDRDDAGRRGALRVASLLPAARIVELPADVGPGGDVTDFFARLHRSVDDFRGLLAAAVIASDHVPRAAPAGLDRNCRLSIAPGARARIDAVKRAVPIERVVGQYVDLSGSSRSPAGRCPFHDDQHPSLAVFPGTGTYHCFGCGAHGDVIGFVRAVERLGFRDTLEVLERFAAR